MSNYVASHGIGPRLPVYPRRVSPTESSEFITRTDLIPVEPHPTDNDIGWLRLYERPITTTGGKDMSCTDIDDGTVLSGANTYPPGPDEFFVAPYQGLVIVHSGRIGHYLNISYIAMGSIVDSEDINYIWELASVNKYISGDVNVPANSSIQIDKIIITELYKKLAANEYTLVNNDNELVVKVFNIDNPETYYSQVINLTSNSITIRYRWTHLFRNEK